MDAWETLLDKSTLGSGDSWEHLNNQAGGGGTVEHGMDFSLEEKKTEVPVVTDNSEITVDESKRVIVLTPEDEVAVDDTQGIDIGGCDT